MCVIQTQDQTVNDATVDVIINNDTTTATTEGFIDESIDSINETIQDVTGRQQEE